MRSSGFFKLLHNEGLRGLFRGAGIKLKRDSAVGYIEPVMTGTDTMIKFFHSGLKKRDLRWPERTIAQRRENDALCCASGANHESCERGNRYRD